MAEGLTDDDDGWKPPTLEDVVRAHVRRVLESHRARGSGVIGAARELAVARSTVQRMIKRWGL